MTHEDQVKHIEEAVCDSAPFVWMFDSLWIKRSLLSTATKRVTIVDVKVDCHFLRIEGFVKYKSGLLVRTSCWIKAADHGKVKRGLSLWAAGKSKLNLTSK